MTLNLMFSKDGVEKMDVTRGISNADILDYLPVAVYVCDHDGYVRLYNEAAVRLWGRRPEIGKDLWCGSWKIYDPDGTPLPPEACPMAEALRTKSPVSGKEIIIEQPGGQRFHILSHPQPIHDKNGVMTGAINMLVDVTDQINFRKLQKHTEQLSETMGALTQSEERYHRMVSDVQDCIIILLSREGLIENWNSGAENIVGYKESEAVGKHFRMFYPAEDQANLLPERLIKIAREEGKVKHEGWRVRKDGTRFWANTSITGLHDGNGAVIGFSKVTRDLTERKKQEIAIRQINEDLSKKNELLRQSEARFQRMVSEIEDYVIVLLNREGFIENWNKGAEKIKGYTAEEIVGKHFSIFYSEDARRKGVPDALLKEAVLKGKALHDGWRLRKDGSSFWGSVIITALHNDEGAVIGFTKVTRDLTDKKIAEEKLLSTSLKLEQKNLELERMNDELSSFAYISSHDLQEPLRKIQTFSDRILELEYENLSEKGRDYFRRIQGGAARMQKLIRDILAYSRTTTSEKKLELTDLNNLLAQSKLELEVSIVEKKAVIENDPLPTLKVIPFLFQQLFTNLLNNALKFSRSGVAPHIVICSERVDSKALPESDQVHAETYWHISIEDNGIGFEQEYEKKIFEVFQRLHGRTEYSGTGIGLAICKKIVENHGGFITADSRPNHGAKFHIYVPVIKEA